VTQTQMHWTYSYAPSFGLYECSCGKSFTKAIKLRNHIRKHNGGTARS
jgi:hypothetical protein